MCRSATAWLTPLLLALALPAAADVTLVREGVPVATIVLAGKPTLGAQLAAFELQHFVRQITGATLDIAREPPGAYDARVYVGESAATRKLGIDTSKLRHQEHLVRTVGRDLVLLGKDKQVFGEYQYGLDWYPYRHQGLLDLDEMGTPFAVYALMERLGMRWYWPGDLGTVIPESEDLNVPDLNLKIAPFMSACRFNGYNPRPLSRQFLNYFRPETEAATPLAPEDLPLDQLRFTNSIWRLRNQSERGYIGGGHSQLLRSYLQRSAKDHPEWWGTNKPVFGSQMCLSNESLKDQIVADIVDAYTGTEDRIVPTLEGIHIAAWKLEVEHRTISLGMEDTANYCQCDRCQPQYEPYDRARWASSFSCGTHSRYVWNFVTEIANRVKAQVADGKIACIAYWVYFYPPEGIKIPDNVIVIPCLHWPYHIDPVMHNYERQALAGWGKLASGRIMTYAYYLFPSYSTSLASPLARTRIPTWNLAFSAPRLLGAELKYAMEHGARGFTAELNGSPVLWDYLNMYITYRLSRDPSLDVDALLKEYYRLFYGPAEVPMGRFWDGLEELYVSPKHQDEAWTATQVLKLGGYLDEAATLAPDPASLYRRRIEMVRTGIFTMLDDSRRIRNWPLAHDFEGERPLAGFTDIWGKMPPDPEGMNVATEEVDGRTNHYLFVPGYFNGMRTVPVPLTVSGDLATIEIKARVRCRDGGPVAIFLTSLDQPEGGGGSYVKGDQGAAFGITGYQYGNEANSLSFHMNGKSASETRKTALLPDTNWHWVRLVYDRAGAKLSARVDDQPWLEQTGVALEGAQFRGVWLRGHKSAYDDLSVTFTRAAR